MLPPLHWYQKVTSLGQLRRNVRRTPRRLRLRGVRLSSNMDLLYLFAWSHYSICFRQSQVSAVFSIIYPSPTFVVMKSFSPAFSSFFLSRAMLTVSVFSSI